MMQQSFADLEYANRKRKTKRDEFLGIMEEVIPWDEWVGIVTPYYPSGKRARPPRGVETMLRMYLLSNWFNLSDEGVEDAVYDSYAFRKFMQVDFWGEGQVPDATTLCKFRKLLNDNGITKLLFDAIREFLDRHGRLLHGAVLWTQPSLKHRPQRRTPKTSGMRRCIKSKRATSGTLVSASTSVSMLGWGILRYNK